MNPVRTYLYKKKHKSGGTTWVVRWKDPKTQLWRSMAGGRTKAEAQALEIRVRSELLKGNDPTPKADEFASLRVVEVIERYYESARFQGVSEGWQTVLRSRFEGRILSAFGDQPVLRLNRERLIQFYLRLKSEGLSHKTIKQYHLALSLIGGYFEELSGHPNPAKTVKDFSRLFPKQATTREINFLLPSEVEAVLAQCAQRRSRRLFQMITILAGTGMRRSEALALEWRDLDFADGFIHIRNSKTAEQRRIPMEPAVRKAFQAMPRRGALVFTRPDGKPMDPGSFLVPLKKAVKKAGIQKRVDLHTLRHSWGSNKLRAGWSIKKVSMMLGHADISITSRVYTHLLDGDLKVRDEYLHREPATAMSLSEVLETLVQTLEGTPATEISAQTSTILQQILARQMQLSGSSGGEMQQSEPKEGRAPLLLREQNPLNVRTSQTSGGFPGFVNGSEGFDAEKNGALKRTRTSNPQIRSLMLYPIEL
jgi:integrase